LEKKEAKTVEDKNGKGPRAGSYMAKSGRVGAKAGHKQGNC